MSLPVPQLDDRTFQQIVDEVRKRIPLYCPEWTDHNVSDPGITLIELFAWMTEMLIYRLNRIPELHYLKFMEFLGIPSESTTAARTRVTFRLTKLLTTQNDPDDIGVDIKVGTEVSTMQTETSAPPVVFTTDSPFTIHAPKFQRVVFARANQAQAQVLLEKELNQLWLGLAVGFPLFSERPPQENDAFYWGFANDLSYHILSLRLEFDTKAGVGINVLHPPYVWEAWTSDGDWVVLGTEDTEDSTRGLNAEGEIVLHLPELGRMPESERTTIANQPERYWVRVRIIRPTQEQIDAGMRAYEESPLLKRIISVAAIGGSVEAIHARVVNKEQIGVSDGSPGQRFYLSGTPVLLPLNKSKGERLRVKVGEVSDYDEELWDAVANFADSNAESRHFVLDSSSGEIRFGPAVRLPNGEIKCYGAIPRRGATLIFERYQYGGGVVGNVGRMALNVLKTSIPYVARVENRARSLGGRDAPGLEALQMAVQRHLRTRHLPVTPDDYEARVYEHFGERVARVKCIPLKKSTEAGSQPTPQAAVRVLLIPPLLPNGRHKNGLVLATELDVPEKLRREIRRHLEQYRMLTVPLQVDMPKYRWVKVKLIAQKRADVDSRTVEQSLTHRLYTLINPVTGGPQGRGWPFGVTLTAVDLQRWLQASPVSSPLSIWNCLR